MSVAAALFDWDGTLIDSRAALLAAWYESSEAVLGRRYPDTQADEDVVFTLPGKQIWPTLASDEAQLAELAAAFQEAYEQGSEQAQAFPGVRDMLLELRASGVAIAVVTSKGRRRFAPDAERGRLTEAIEKLDVAAQSAVMIGDTPVDIAAGIAAGVSTIGVTWGHFGEAELRAAGAEAVADRPADVLGILLGENAHTTTTGGAA
jgi:phosphoglycolate phosphatase-like HAD superfamily hydrolase